MPYLTRFFFMHHGLRLACLSLLIFLILGCTRSESTKLVITGSSTVAPIMAEIAREYEQRNKAIRIDVQTGGSSRGIADARAKLADIGMVSRTLTEEENDLKAHIVAYDGIAMVLNKNNPIVSLSDEQLKSIYTGKIINWNALGGPDKKIIVVSKAEGRSTLDVFLKYFQLKNRDIHADLIVGDNQQGLKTVAGNLWAIGYVSIGAAEYEIAQGETIKLMGLGGVAASTRAIKDGKYPLSRSLNMVTYGEVSALADDFILFAQSDKVHHLIEKQYLIPATDK